MNNLDKNFNKWNHFRVIQKFTFLPLRIYQYTSQRTWWSWLKTTYVLQAKRYPSDGHGRGLIGWFNSYFYGHWWSNSRISNVDEYNDYIKKKQEIYE
jgi:hypothetical protein